MSVNAGACMSLKGELAQEHEQIRHLQRIEKNKTYKVYRQFPRQYETDYIYTRGTALLTKIGLIGNVTVSPTEIAQPVVSTITEFILI